MQKIQQSFFFHLKLFIDLSNLKLDISTHLFDLRSTQPFLMHLLSTFLFISQRMPTGTMGADSNLCGNNRVRIFITWWYQNVKSLYATSAKEKLSPLPI